MKMLEYIRLFAKVWLGHVKPDGNRERGELMCNGIVGKHKNG
jgi:hypothetical protein